MGPYHSGSQQCPICPWEGKNRYYHMRARHRVTMSDWEQMTPAQQEDAKKGIIEPRFSLGGGQHLPYKTFQ